MRGMNQPLFKFQSRLLRGFRTAARTRQDIPGFAIHYPRNPHHPACRREDPMSSMEHQPRITLHQKLQVLAAGIFPIRTTVAAGTGSISVILTPAEQGLPMMRPIIANNWVCGQQAGSIESRINLPSPHTDELDILESRKRNRNDNKF